MKVQLNHPGGQKFFEIDKGYKEVNGNIVRTWNTELQHYRKFIHNKGHYISYLDDLTPIESDLFFWGEWEGDSFFQPIINPDYRILPNGIHRLFYSTFGIGSQNTDPYIYGHSFKYCICKQRGRLRSLQLDDLIIFGTVMPSLGKFFVDTVLVVKVGQSSRDIQANGGFEYSQVYKAQTLNRLSEYLGSNRVSAKTNVYHGKSWWDDQQYFSFVPCKLECGTNGFERVFVELTNPLFQLSTNSQTNVSYLRRCMLDSRGLWFELVKICLSQGFLLGVRFEEPEIASFC
jgi:hypothetical protein